MEIYPDKKRVALRLHKDRKMTGRSGKFLSEANKASITNT
jgi:hypothetical protein